MRAAVAAVSLVAAGASGGPVGPREAFAHPAQRQRRYRIAFVPAAVGTVCVGDEVPLRFRVERAVPVDPRPAALDAPGAGVGEGADAFTISALGGAVTPTRVRLHGLEQTFTVRFRATESGLARVTVRGPRGDDEASQVFSVANRCERSWDQLVLACASPPSLPHAR